MKALPWSWRIASPAAIRLSHRLKSTIDARYDRNLAEIFRQLIAAGAWLAPPR
jgi:hypothetical protein